MKTKKILMILISIILMSGVAMFNKVYATESSNTSKTLDNWSFDWIMTDKNKLTIEEGENANAEFVGQIVDSSIETTIQDVNVEWKIEDETIAEVVGEASDTQYGVQKIDKSAIIKGIKAGTTKLTAVISDNVGDEIELEIQIEVKGEEDENQENEEIQDKQDEENSKDETEENKQETDNKSTENNNENTATSQTQDSTVSTKVLAKTGEGTTIFSIVAIFSIFSLVCFAKYKKINF